VSICIVQLHCTKHCSGASSVFKSWWNWCSRLGCTSA